MSRLVTTTMKPLWISSCLLLGASGAAAQDSAADSAWLASKGFFQRTDYAVQHLDRERIQALRAGTVSRLIADLPRLEARRDARGWAFVLHATASWRDTPADTGCTLAVFLNGGEVREGTDGHGGAVGIDRVVRTGELDGLEVHAGELSPVNAGLPCGSILLWSRANRGRVDEEFTGVLRARALQLPEATPLAGIRMTLQPGGIEQVTDSGGWASFGMLIPGRYQMEAMTQTGETWTGEVWVRAFAISQVAIEVERSVGTAAPGR